MIQERIIDGADRRKSRLLNLLLRIHEESVNGDGLTSTECQSFMLLTYGLRHSTTAKYLQELHIAKVIFKGGTASPDKWRTTSNFRKSTFLKQLYGGE